MYYFYAGEQQQAKYNETKVYVQFIYFFTKSYLHKLYLGGRKVFLKLQISFVIVDSGQYFVCFAGFANAQTWQSSIETLQQNASLADLLTRGESASRAIPTLWHFHFIRDLQTFT